MKWPRGLLVAQICEESGAKLRVGVRIGIYGRVKAGIQLEHHDSRGGDRTYKRLRNYRLDLEFIRTRRRELRVESLHLEPILGQHMGSS